MLWMKTTEKKHTKNGVTNALDKRKVSSKKHQSDYQYGGTGKQKEIIRIRETGEELNTNERSPARMSGDP